MKTRKIFIQFLSVLIFLSVSGGVYAQGPRGRFGRGPDGVPFMSQLADSQKAELKTLMQDLRDQDADRKAVRKAIDGKLNEWGIEMPTRPNGMGPFGDNLTEVQKDELQILIADLKAKDTPPEEIRKAVRDKLKEWDITLPERPEGFGRGPRGFFGQGPDQRQGPGFGMPQPFEGRKGLPFGRRGDRRDGRRGAWQHPGAFNPETVMTYRLDDAADVTINIFDSQGQRVRTLKDGQQTAGRHIVRWDGRSDSGERVQPDTYLYKIQAGKTTLSSGRMLMIK